MTKSSLSSFSPEELPPKAAPKLRGPLEIYRKALLLEVVAALAKGEPANSSWFTIADKMRWIMDFDHARLILFPRNTGPLTFATVIGAQPEYPALTAMQVVSFQTRANALGDAGETSSVFVPTANIGEASPSPKSGMLVLCRTKSRIHGAMLFTSSLDRAFGHPEVELAGYLAGQLALSLERLEHVELVATQGIERQRAREVLTRTEKLASMGRLTATIAHEINNPLEAVTNLLFLARTEPETSQVVKNYLLEAEGELKRISDIANETLRFHKQSKKPTAATAEELFRTVLVIHQVRLQGGNIAVERALRASDPVFCFEGEIRQVLNNLVANAIDAMHRTGGRLVLRSAPSKDWKTNRLGLCITVADTGTGMDALTAARIFDPFFTTKELEGTGLGLWVTQEIVESHRGTIRLRSSERVGASGTVFRLFLPFEAADR